MHLNYYQRLKRCGKLQCRTCQQAGGHGPYWFVSQTINGKTVEKYIGRQLPTSIQRTIGRTNQSDFVGRSEELAQLLETLETTEGQRHPRRRTRNQALPATQTVLLTGEAGIGKTRLAEEMAREAVRRSWSVLWIDGVQASHVPYRLWTELLRLALERGLWKRLGVLRQPERYRPLQYLLPDILDLWKNNPCLPDQLQLWESLRLLLQMMTAKTTILVVFDDLHWADHSSCELLNYLARQMNGMHAMFLGTCYETELSSDHPLQHLLALCQPGRPLQRLALGPLSNEYIAQLIAPAPDALRKRILVHAGGNPLFAEELARSSFAYLSARSQRLPETIAAVFALRLSHLSPECLRLLECGAVLGNVFLCDLLEALGKEVMDLDEQMLIALLEEAIQAKILTEEGEGSAILYRFWHPLLRSHLYSQLSAVRRARLHRRAAHLLRAYYTGREAEGAGEVLAQLTSAGASPTSIARYAELAADHAYALSDYPEAESYYQMALDKTQQEIPMTFQEALHRSYLLQQLGECMRIRGKGEAARASYEQALLLYQIQNADADGHTVSIQALLWTEIGLCWYDANDLGQACECYGNAERLLHQAGIQNGPAYARLRYEQGYLAWREGRYQEALSLATEALTTFERKKGEPDASTAYKREDRSIIQRVCTADGDYRYCCLISCSHIHFCVT